MTYQKIFLEHLEANADLTDNLICNLKHLIHLVSSLCICRLQTPDLKGIPYVSAAAALGMPLMTFDIGELHDCRVDR